MCVCVCVFKLCVREASGGGEEGGARRECTTKNKNPTQRCGEQFATGPNIFEKINHFGMILMIHNDLKTM